MPKRTDLSDCTLLPDHDALSRLSIAIGLEIQSLPQLKGKGKPTRIDAEQAVKMFAERVFARMTTSNTVFAMGPPGVPSTNYRAPKPDENAEITVGIPRHNDLPQK